MFYAMNRFPVAAGREEEFEEVWRTRESRLKELPGFVSFQMLKGDEKDGKRIFISKTLWNSREDFIGWTKSEQFRASHGKSRMPQGVMIGPPAFESYEVVIDEK
jgi:heme-degrading monooxygenase HmoA